MNKLKKNAPPDATAPRHSNSFHFNLTGLVVFSLLLMLGAAGITYKLAGNTHPKLAETFAVHPNDKSRSIHMGAWGELITRDIQLERPDEYLSSEATAPAVE